ncbi:glycerophosphodiester phosphodiesterase [Paenibacillus chartarius]|uniref:Glycerophosphodiester phosphodiesterase n=1 Tax=Paenibacillus chartarius TaxID=747481 RepID=A0ABV6DH36_9BACL
MLRKLNMQAALALAMVLLTVVLAGCGQQAQTVQQQEDKSRELVMAHRGSSGSAPENTKASVLKAIEDGAGYAEIDVQETRDGVVVLLHDDNLRRTANINKSIWEIDSSEALKADVGAWYKPNFAGETLPALEEIMKLAKGRIKLNIELKQNGHQKQLAEKVVHLIEANQFANECVVTSMDLGLVNTAKSLNSKLQAGWIIDAKQQINDSIYDMKFEILSVKSTLIDQDMMNKAKQKGKRVMAWTVNDDATAERMLALGIDGIITNYPDRVLKLIAERKQAGS